MEGIFGSTKSKFIEKTKGDKDGKLVVVLRDRTDYPNYPKRYRDWERKKSIYKFIPDDLLPGCNWYFSIFTNDIGFNRKVLLCNRINLSCYIFYRILAICNKDKTILLGGPWRKLN